MFRYKILLFTAATLATLGGTPANAADQGWVRKIHQLIAAKHTYPRSAQLRREEGSAKVKVAFSPSGAVLGVDLIQSSGSAILDREAVRIPTKVGEFPPPPNGSSTNLVIPISFRMN